MTIAVLSIVLSISLVVLVFVAFLPLMNRYAPPQAVSIKSTLLQNKSLNDKVTLLIASAGAQDILDALKLYQIIIAVFVLGSAVFILKGFYLGILIAAVTSVGGPFVILTILKTRRQLLLNKQLVPFLNEMATRMRDSASAPAAFESAISNTDAPLRPVLEKVRVDESLYNSFEAALEASSMLISSNYWQDFISAMHIYSEVNGDIQQIILTLVQQIRDNEVLLARFNASMASMRINLIIILLAPLVIGSMVLQTSSDMSELLFTTISGWVIMAIVAVLYVGGIALALWTIQNMRKEIVG